MLVLRSPCKTILTSHMGPHIVAATKKWLPGYAEHGTLPTGVVRGTALQKLLSSLSTLRMQRLKERGPLIKLDAAQQKFQSIVGELR